MADLKFCARFPFSKQSREYAKEAKLALSPESISGAEKRIAGALKDGKIALPTGEFEEELKGQISNYAASRAILAAWQNNYVRARVAVAESKAAAGSLSLQTRQNEEYEAMIAQNFGITFEGQESGGKEIFVPFWDYLQNAPKDRHYKLSNMELEKGKIKITRAQKLRILEEAIKKYLEAPLPKLKNAPKEIKEAIMRLEKSLPREEIMPASISKTDFPPCIKQMLDELALSKNLPHSARVALAIYLTKAGLSDEQIIAVFSKAPDYNKDTTKYQVEYIRKKGYTMQSCATMDTYGICVAECRCYNPIKYRKQLHEKFAVESMQREGENTDESKT